MLRRNRERAGRARPGCGEAGFTLLELLIVLVILGMLAALATTPVLRYLGRAKTDTAEIQIQNLSGTLDLFRLDVGRYPTQDEGLRALVEKPASADRWNGPYVEKEASLTDPWGGLYLYRMPGEHGEFDLYSLGADKAAGGSGEDRDVTSW